jgi:hypothetical protein
MRFRFGRHQSGSIELGCGFSKLDRDRAFEIVNVLSAIGHEDI